MRHGMRVVARALLGCGCAVIVDDDDQARRDDHDSLRYQFIELHAARRFLRVWHDEDALTRQQEVISAPFDVRDVDRALTEERSGVVVRTDSRVENCIEGTWHCGVPISRNGHALNTFYTFNTLFSQVTSSSRACYARAYNQGVYMKSGQSFSVGQIIAICASVGIIALGILFITATIDASQFSIWLPVILILAGLFVLPNASSDSDKAQSSIKMTTIAVAMVGIGGFILLRQLGVIETGIVRYALGAFLVGVGLYGIFRNLNRIQTKTIE